MSSDADTSEKFSGAGTNNGLSDIRAKSDVLTKAASTICERTGMLSAAHAVSIGLSRGPRSFHCDPSQNKTKIVTP
jgi:hypothetical protein